MGSIIDSARVLLEAAKTSMSILRGGRSTGMTVEDIANKHGVSVAEIQAQLKIGLEIEKEHTDIPAVARKISCDHLVESPVYYTHLVKMEKEIEAEADTQ